MCDVGERSCIWRHNNAALSFCRFDDDIWENLYRHISTYGSKLNRETTYLTDVNLIMQKYRNY